MGEKIVEFLVVLVASFVLCRAVPDLTKDVDFYREGENITATWGPLDKVYVGIQIEYWDVTIASQPYLVYNVRDVKVTKVTFRVTQFSKYECSLLVHDVGPLKYTSPRMPASFRPNFSNITFVQKGEFITGTWHSFGSSYTSLKVRWCVAKDSSCDLHTVRTVSATTATFTVDKNMAYYCSVLVIDVSGESHLSGAILAVKDPSNSNIIIIIVVVVIVLGLIVVAVVLYLVLRNYCRARDAYAVMPETEKEAKQAQRKRRKVSVDYVISDDEDNAKYRGKDHHGQDNHAFIENEKENTNGNVKGAKVKKDKKDKTKYIEPTIEYSPNDATVEIDLRQEDAISLSSKSSQGDRPSSIRGRLEVDVEASMPDVVTLPELNRKMSTDLDADSDVIDDADVALEVEVEAPVDVTPFKSGDGPYVEMGLGKTPSSGGYVDMKLPEGTTPLSNNVNIQILPPPDDSGGSVSSTSHSDADVEFDGEIASRGSIDIADPRFHDSRYDGTFDLRFVGASNRDSVDSDRDSDDLDIEAKPDYEPLESEDDSNVMNAGWSTGLQTQSSLESVEELNLDLAYGAKPDEPVVNINLPPIDVEGELDSKQPMGKLETTDKIDVGPFDLQVESDVIADVIPDHAGVVIDADRDGGLIHVQEGIFINADVDIPGGEVSFGTPEKNIDRESQQNSFREKVNSERNEPPKRRISRKCSKLGNAEHICSHVTKERRHSRSESTSSICSTCTTTSIETSSPTFSRSYRSSGSDTEKDVNDIEDEDGDALGIRGQVVKDSVGVSGEVGLDLDADARNNFELGIGTEIDVDTGLSIDADTEGVAELGINADGDAMLLAPVDFADEINIGAEDTDDEVDLDSGRPKSTGLNLNVDLGLGVSLI